mmetsp:Transcript_17536/g.52996  ORF Transcript_17536/g.52996 Transcript_17536/m.52996 type:complete len:214 (+) Transcript_17536:1398-2039(+)
MPEELRRIDAMRCIPSTPRCTGGRSPTILAAREPMDVSSGGAAVSESAYRGVEGLGLRRRRASAVAGRSRVCSATADLDEPSVRSPDTVDGRSCACSAPAEHEAVSRTGRLRLAAAGDCASASAALRRPSLLAASVRAKPSIFSSSPTRAILSIRASTGGASWTLSNCSGLTRGGGARDPKSSQSLRERKPSREESFERRALRWLPSLGNRPN